MESDKIQNSIVKYLSDQATFSELDELDEWIKDPKNEELFKSYIRTNYAIDYNMKKFNSEKIKMMLATKVANERKVIRHKKIRKKILYMTAASLIIGTLAINFVFNNDMVNTPLKNTQAIVSNTVKVGTDKAILTLEDGSVVPLQKGDKYQTKTAVSNGEEIVYDAGKRNSSKIAYNYLTIPRGGQFHLVLSDNTEVWLNSDTQLKFPVSFKDGVTRQVELVYGEAFFEVSPSTKHKGAKFKVLNQFQQVEVLGTHFNIKAYKNDTNIYTTLVEGKVSVRNSGNTKILKPYEQAKLDLKNNTMAISEVDVYNEISWKDGVFGFKRKSLEEIMIVLSRWYDLEVKFSNPELKKAGFNGTIGKDQKIEEVLETIKGFGIIKDYKITGKTVILK